MIAVCDKNEQQPKILQAGFHSAGSVGGCRRNMEENISWDFYRERQLLLQEQAVPF